MVLYLAMYGLYRGYRRRKLGSAIGAVQGQEGKKAMRW